MLPSNELSKLYKIISDENQTFQNISQKFVESFNKCDYLKIAISLCILIKDNLLNIQQRLISFYILYNMQKSDNIEISPFLPLLIDVIQTTKHKAEQAFLLDFLYNQINYLNITIKDYIQDTTKAVKINISHLQLLYEKYNSEKNKLNNNKKSNGLSKDLLK